ncbi:hypothetical protein HaLaN_20025, partial [Haematococcus lacustris]
MHNPELWYGHSALCASRDNATVAEWLVSGAKSSRQPCLGLLLREARRHGRALAQFAHHVHIIVLLFTLVTWHGRALAQQQLGEGGGGVPGSQWKTGTFVESGRLSGRTLFLHVLDYELYLSLEAQLNF